MSGEHKGGSRDRTLGESGEAEMEPYVEIGEAEIEPYAELEKLIWNRIKNRGVGGSLGGRRAGGLSSLLYR